MKSCYVEFDIRSILIMDDNCDDKEFMMDKVA